MTKNNQFSRGRTAGEKIGNHLFKIGLEKKQLRPCVGQDVTDLLAGKAEIDGNQDGPPGSGGADQRKEFGTVFGQNGDPVSPADPLGSQPAAHRRHLVMQLPEGDLPVLRLNRYPVFKNARVPFENVINGKTAEVHMPLPLIRSKISLQQQYVPHLAKWLWDVKWY